MSQQDRPPIVADLKKGRTTGGITSKLGDTKPLNAVSYGGRFARPFQLFTWVLSAGIAVSFVAVGVGEKDHRGKDHVFSGIHRFMMRKRDEFFYVGSAENNEK
mmetsp:Transcript_2656/g.3005  ORF Transcript_2656/g.3005 Transcript_2656/m.3005 type:complete len:103 (+) Transcript_2656:203-511(+)